MQTISYRSLVRLQIDGLLVCEKTLSHIANSATRLQPVVMNIPQAAGMARCARSLNVQPKNLSYLAPSSIATSLIK